MKQKSKIFYIILVFALILGGIYLIWRSNNNKEQQPMPQPEAADLYEYGDEQSPIPYDTGQSEEQVSTDFETEGSEYQVYTNSTYNFSFKYPEGFTVANFQEGEYGETILVRKEPASPELQRGEQVSFQIFISPFDEPGPLTKERILEDLPDMIVEDAQQRLLKNGVPGLIFFSQEPSLGKTREVWFIHNGYLYQVSTYAELDKWLASILGTWKFH